MVWVEDGTFRSDAETARDPVCGRVIEVRGAPQLEQLGATFYFCAELRILPGSALPFRRRG